MATGIAQGLNSMATALFVTGTGTESDPYALSTFGAIVAIFAGIALAVGLTTLVTRWIMSLRWKKLIMFLTNFTIEHIPRNVLLVNAVLVSMAKSQITDLKLAVQFCYTAPKSKITVDTISTVLLF